MGGNALSYVTSRLDKSVADRVAADCVAKLQALYPGRRMAYLSSYRTKPDAGDADILVEADERYNPHQAAEALGAVEVVRNGPVTSLGVLVQPELGAIDGNVFQVDLIRSAPAEFDYSCGYFMWSDLGNLVGRIAHAGGTAHRHDGLYFYVRDQDYLFRTILLTQDHDKALAYMGYAPARFNEGFDTLEDIFQYAASSAFFNADIYLLENRNAKSRIRDRKRLAYMEFLKFCEAHPELPAYQYPESKAAWLPRIAAHFPHFQAEYDQALADLAAQREVKSKFNGEWVSQLTGLRGKELGMLMKHFKESFESPEAMRDYLRAKDLAAIEMRVRRVLSRLNEDGLFPMWELLEAGIPVHQVCAQVERNLESLLALPVGTEGVAAAVEASREMLKHVQVPESA